MIPKKVIKRIVRKFPRRIHKKQRGSVLIIAGSRSMPGAAVLAAQAAFRTGAGLVTMAYPSSFGIVYRRLILEALHMPLPHTKSGVLARESAKEIVRAGNSFDSILVGPGLTTSPSVQHVVRQVIKKTRKPLIIDADGLNAIAAQQAIRAALTRRESPSVLTPHEGEMARLTGLKANYIRAHRKETAIKFARRLKSVLVLKGNGTVIAAPDGSSFINSTGGPFLATAGTGDVLAGIIAALVAQNPDNVFHAAAAGAYIHGLAGEWVAKELGERSVMATDLLGMVPGVLTRILK